MTDNPLPEAAHTLAHDDDLRPLWAAVHKRLCSGTEPTQLATVLVNGLPTGGIAILRTWLDTSTRRRRGPSAITTANGSTRVPVRMVLSRFDLAPEHLTAIAELAMGEPVVNQALARRAGVAAREDLWLEVVSNLAAVPELARRIRATGVAESDIATIAKQSRQLRAALEKIDNLRRPGTPPLTLPKLAHDCAHDPHAFDLDSLTGKRLVEAVAELLGEPEPARPDRVRAMLARAGVLADRLSTTVLVLNLSAVGIGIVDQRLRLGGGPVPLTLYDLTVNPPVLQASPLLVVENPSVLEAAMATGFTGPLACTSGHLRAVEHAFLQCAVDCGVELTYAGDIDRDGLIIACQVRELYGARIVGMDEDVVLQAGPCSSAVPLGVLPAELPFELSAALSAGGKAIYQENDVILEKIL
ncbi:TIGR02679 family protein [Amycolatopsis xylanica]|uniref:TIGR02679 family protein n=1 Tax=Amycolatopsis xylanica TaxID=589385 RepID=A0A1H2SG29_9PSEU|nr:TIGR02679 family protein [Amycolatopsis xylanica]